MQPLVERLPDGTVKQRNPFTGTQVWTMPGRGRRPLPKSVDEPQPLPPGDGVQGCAFCPGHGLDNPPEKARLVPQGDGWRTLAELDVHGITATQPDFRLVPNLFEICSLDYWRLNHDVEVPQAARDRASTYLADPDGRDHLRRVLALRERIGGLGRDEQALEAELEHAALGWFASGHQLVIPRRHHVDGATSTDQLASSGTLTVAEHRAYINFTVEAMATLYAENPAARYVSVFQNWLRPAGASFEHLHRQLVAIDEVGEHVAAARRALELDPQAFNTMALDVAIELGLVVAANPYAVAFAGFGHRYPSVEVVSLSPRREPWLMSREEVAGFSDVLHAVHVAGGPLLACNEEWHHRPPAFDDAMPWRVVVKWRNSTLAGFEGDTKIYLNTLSPWDVRDRVVAALDGQRGRLASGLAVGDECRVAPGSVPC